MGVRQKEICKMCSVGEAPGTRLGTPGLVFFLKGKQDESQNISMLTRHARL